MRDILPKIAIIIVSIIIVTLPLVVFFVSYKSYTAYNEKLWNDGHCDICGGSWQFEQAVGHRSSTSYIYSCPGCGKRIEIDEVR